MNIDTLYSIITNSNWYNGISLELPNDAVDTNGPVYTLINTWMGTKMGVANITQQPVKSGNTVTLSGSMNILNQQNLIVKNIVFSIIDGNGKPATDGNPALFIDVPLPANWTFGSSFPMISGSSIDSLTFLQAHFLLSSYQQDPSNNYPTLSPGLNFYSPSLQTSSMVLAAVKGLIGGGDSLAISGPITILSGNITVLPQLLPALALASQTSSVTLASFLTLPVTLQCTTALVPPLNTIGTFVLLSSQVQVGTAEPIGISVDISDVGKQLVFEADLGKEVTHTLQELASFLNNAPVGDELKKYIDKFSNYITLKSVRVYLATRFINQDISKALGAIAVDVGSTSDWDVLPGYFDLQSFDVTFMVNNVVTSPSITTIVWGSVEFVDSIDLLLSASFPDVSFDIQLQPNHTIQLSDIFKKLWPAAAGYADITCNQFNISGTPGQNTYSLSAGFTGAWNINSGIRQINLEEALLTLNYDKNAVPTTSGSLNATVDFVDNGDGNPIAEFVVNWTIPGPFQLQGSFPDINLTQLANSIVGVADLSLPSGFPQLDLKNTTVTLTVSKGTNNTQGTIYDFSIVSTVQINSTDIGLLFEIQKAQSWGCVVGVWTENWSWSPADQWPNIFGTILKGISFSKTGLIISSLTNPSVQLPNPPTKIPSQIGQGVTFFTEIDFSGPALSVLNKFFPNATGINFYAYLADPLSQSMFIGTVGASSSTQKYSFDGLQFSVTPANQSFTIQTGVTFSFNEIAGPNKGKLVNLDFIGGATISLEGEFDLFFVLKATDANHIVTSKRLARHARRKQVSSALLSPTHPKLGPPPSSPGWKDPLGLQGLTVENFWGEIGVNAAGEISFGFGGAVAIGDQDPVDLEMDLDGGVDGEVPILNAFVFKISEEDQGKSIQLTDLIKKFTTLDLNWVPILNGISFKEFMLYVVLNPQGFRNPATGTVYPMGFFSSGDITFYGFEAVFDVEIYFSTGIKAYGYINKPLSFADGILQLSDAQGDKGPYGLIDTTFLINPKPDKPYLELSGSLTLLGFTDTLYAYIEEGKFYFEMKLDNFVLKEHVICSLNYSSKSVDFMGTIGGSISLHVSTPPISKDGIPILPAITIDFDLDLSITITINPGFKFHVTGSFAWGTLTLTVDFYLIDIKSWSDLKKSIEDFFTKYPKELWRDLINSADKLVSALEQDLFEAASDIAKILHDAYGVLADDAAKYLADLGWTADQIVNALEGVWGKTKEEAEKIVGDIAHFCSVTQAYMQSSYPSVYTMRPDAELLQALALAPHAQDLLFEYYKNQPLINEYSTSDKDLRARLRRMLNDHLTKDQNVTPPVEDIITYFKELGKKAGPAAAADLEPLISKLRPFRSLSYADFVIAMQQYTPGGLIANSFIP